MPLDGITAYIIDFNIRKLTIPLLSSGLQSSSNNVLLFLCLFQQYNLAAYLLRVFSPILLYLYFLSILTDVLCAD